MPKSYLRVTRLSTPLIDQSTKVSLELAEAKSQLSEIISDPAIRILEAKIKGLKERTADLEKKDPSCTSTTCAFIVGALKATEEIKTTEPKLVALRAETVQKITAAQAVVDQKVKELAEINAQLGKAGTTRKALEAEGFRLKSELEKVKEIAADRERIAIAESRRNDLIARKNEIITEGKRIREEWDARIDEKRTAQGELNVQIMETRAALDLLADNKVADIQAIINMHRAHIDEAVADISKKETQLAALEREAAIKAETVSRLAGLSADRERAVNEAADWLYLKNACSKDGLRALEIDSVAPIISGYANDLLTQTFGPQYTVKLRTQDEETGKEVLDVLTIRDDGSEVLIDNLSGGERVWSLKAMRLAMTLISKEKSGKAFTSFLADEEDGGLDSENAQSFIGMYRSFMKSGGFDTGFFISHKPECVSMADHVLKFGNDGIVIE